MTEAPERIWIIPCTAFDVDWQEGQYTAIEQPNRAEYVRADLPAAVTVKPLEWQGPYTCNGYREGNWKAREFSIQREGENRYRLFRNHIDRHETVFETLGEAKAAAQADYERRILSCHITQPDPDRVLARHQPCGCIICQCEDEEQCHGCGAKTCGTHPVGDIPDPVFADQREAALRDMAEFDGKLLTQPDPVKDAARELLAACPNPVFDHLKPVLMGEFSVPLPVIDENGDEGIRNVNVPWVVIKDVIHAALRALAEQEQSDA